jgi:hypothetical protein
MREESAYAGTATENATATAPAKDEHSSGLAGNAEFEQDSAIDLNTSTQERTAPSPFSEFRSWLSREIQRRPVTLEHVGDTWSVEDITHDGKLRIARGTQTVMLTFVEPYIPALLKQVLPQE